MFSTCRLGVCCATLLSKIFQWYRSSQFYWRKPEYQRKPPTCFSHVSKYFKKFSYKFVPIANSEMKKNCNSTVYNMYNKNIKLKFDAKIFVLSSFFHHFIFQKMKVFTQLGFLWWFQLLSISHYTANNLDLLSITPLNKTLAYKGGQVYKGKLWNQSACFLFCLTVLEYCQHHHPTLPGPPLNIPPPMAGPLIHRFVIHHEHQLYHQDSL